MDDKFLKIEDYFKYSSKGSSSRDLDDIERIRVKINSFENEKDILEWLDARRQSSYVRQEDFRLFGVAITDKVNNDGLSRVNEFYHAKDEEDYTNDNDSIKQRSYQKKDRKGNYKYKRDGTIAEYGGARRNLINLSNNIENSLMSKNVHFLAVHLRVILTMIAIILIAIALMILGIYTFGIADSAGHTPFVLCGQDEITGKSSVQVASGTIKEMATTEYAAKIFVSVAKQKGWKNEAIIGVMSYILQEGSGMGSFTYENYYGSQGPSNILFDKTLNNKMWISWLSSAGKTQAHSVYAARNSSYYASIGLGLLQNSDVWRNDGSMDDTGATALIKYAEAKGKPWQDTITQITYYFDDLFSKNGAFDTFETGQSKIDPTKDVRTAEEWCRRVTAGVGMPALNWNDNSSYILDHTKHLAEASAIVGNSNGNSSLYSLDEQTQNPCGNTNSIISGGNASIADAAVTLASNDIINGKILWDVDGPNSVNLNDQKLKTYKKVHMEIFPNDQYFASCDRAAASAIVWSGADKDFPAGGNNAQYNYLKSSAKWNYVGDYTKDTALKPGDVLITKGDGHIKIYVGAESSNKRFAGSTSNMYAASSHDYFPILYKDEPGYDVRTFAVFRNVTN